MTASAARKRTPKAVPPPAATADLDIDDTDDVGPGSDDVFHYQTTLGPVSVMSASKAKPNALAMQRLKRDKDYGAVMLLVTEAAADPDTFELLCNLPGDELEQFYREWGIFSGVTVGE